MNDQHRSDDSGPTSDPGDRGTLTVVTGPTGVDIGPVCAELGRSLGDGLTVRTVVSDTYGAVLHGLKHTSPIPAYVPARLHEPGTDGRSQILGVQPSRIALHTLPSAWQNPDTNLGVAYSGGISALTADFDLRRLDHLGMHPGHRLTMQHRSPHPAGHQGATAPPPVEVGDLAAHARDSVLRTGGRVLVEAGNGQTFLDALQIVGIAPWSPYVERLELWVVLDVTGLTLSGGGYDPTMVISVINAEIQRNGGLPHREAVLYVALLGLEALLPGLAGVGDPDILDNGVKVDEATEGALGDLVDEIERRCNVEAPILGTGVSTFINLH